MKLYAQIILFILVIITSVGVVASPLIQTDAEKVTVKEDLQVNGNFIGAYNNYTADTTINGQFMVTCDASTGAKDITLQTAVGIEGQMYYIKKIDGTDNPCNIITNGSETIDGLDDGQILDNPFISVGFVSDGANWWTFIRRASGGHVAPTLSNYSVIGTFQDWTGIWRLTKKDGDYIRIQETTANPGFQAWWIFPNVHAPAEIEFEGCIYDGANNDDVESIIFNHASSVWYDLRLNAINATPSESDWQHTSYTDESSPHDRHYSVPAPYEDYVDSNGNVWVGIKHTEAGNTGHNYYCDAIHVESF